MEKQTERVLEEEKRMQQIRKPAIRIGLLCLSITIFAAVDNKTGFESWWFHDYM